MYPTSSAYQKAVCASVRTDRVNGSLTLTDGTVLTLTDADIVSGSLCMDNQCVNGEELAFGCAYLGQVSLQLRTDLSRYALYGACLRLDYALLLPDASWETVPLGVFTVAEAERRAGFVSLKAYDNLVKLDTRYDGSVLAGTAYEILRQIAENCGLALGQTAAEIAALNPNAALSRQLDATYNVDTWRDCAAAVAQLLGGFATVDRSGQLVVRTFAAAPCRTLDKTARSKTAVADYLCRCTALVLELQNGTAVSTADPDDGLTLTVTDFPLAENGLPATRQSICDNLFAALQTLPYTPAEVRLPGDPALDLGDRLALPMADGTAPEMLITHTVWKYRGGQTVKAVGKNPYLAGGGDRTEARLRSLAASAEANRTIYYCFTNASKVQAAETEKTVANLSFVTTRDTGAVFMAQLLLTAAPSGDTPLTVTVRYYMDGVPLDYAPRQSMAAGEHTLALFYPFAELLGAATRRWSVRLVCEGGTVTVEKGGLKAVISGQGMAAGKVWDGTLTAEETLPAVALTALPALTLRPLQGRVSAAVQTPTGGTLAAVLGTVALPALPLLTFAPMTEGLGAATVEKTWTLTTAARAVYDKTFVTTQDGQFALRRLYTAESTACPVDSGLCSAVTVDTTPFTKVEKIEVIW